jgi:hypothetical protein
MVHIFIDAVAFFKAVVKSGGKEHALQFKVMFNSTKRIIGILIV